MNRRQEAYEILRDLDLLERRRPHGDVMIVGSVATDLVVAPDIDLEVHSPAPPSADGFAVLAPLADHPKVRRPRRACARLLALQAVLDHGIRTFPDFQAWLGSRNIYDRTGWLPTSSSSPQSG